MTSFGHLAVIFVTLTSMFAVIIDGGSSSSSSDRGSQGEQKEYCQEETFTASCDQPHQVVLMTSARYGRLRIGRCVKRNLGYLGCAVDALPVLDARCSGQPGTGCELSIMDQALRDLKPCPKDVTWHLEASYQCVEVLFGSVHECHSRRQASVAQTSGYLSSAVAARTQVGSASCPWHLVAAPGQRINITLFSFVSASGLSQPDGTGAANVYDGSRPSGGGPEVCYDVATVRDGSRSPSMVTSCSGEPRQRQVFVSESNVVHLDFVVRTTSSSSALSGSASNTAQSSPQFLIHYQFVGCPTLANPAGATAIRDGDITTIRCNQTGETWYMHCNGSHWTGSIGNCSTQSSQTSWTAEELFGQSGSFPVGILIVVAVGVALGVFLGGTMLLFASMFMKRRHRRHGLGRPDGSDDLKSMGDIHDVGDQSFDYPVSGCGGDQFRTVKHYVMPEYSLRKDYVIGATTTDMLIGGPGGGVSVASYGDMSSQSNTTAATLVADYPTESRGHVIRGLTGTGNTSTLTMTPTPRIHYHHVYESPQLT